MVKLRPLAVAEGMGELEDARHPRRQQLLHRVFGRGVEIEALRAPEGLVQRRFDRAEMRLHPRRNLERRGLDFDEVPAHEIGAQRRGDPRACVKRGGLFGEMLRLPPAPGHPLDSAFPKDRYAATVMP